MSLCSSRYCLLALTFVGLYHGMKTHNYNSRHALNNTAPFELFIVLICLGDKAGQYRWKAIRQVKFA